MTKPSKPADATQGPLASTTTRITPPSEWPPERVRELRKSKGWLLREAANHAGVSLVSWQRWEMDESLVSARRPRGTAAKVLEGLEGRKGKAK